MTFLCNGVFADNEKQPNTPSKKVLGGLENIVVTMLNRGLIPGEGPANNLFICDGGFKPVYKPSPYVDPDPNKTLTVSGASMICVPTQIPVGTEYMGVTFDCTIDFGDGNLQPVKGTIDIPGGGCNINPPKNAKFYCNSVVVQPVPKNQTKYPQGQLQFYFTFNRAGFPNGYPKFKGALSGTYPQKDPLEVIFTGKDLPKGIKPGMEIIDLNAQNPGYVSEVNDAQNELTLHSSINGFQSSPNPSTLMIGNFYPLVDGKPLNRWNAYAAYLHYGGGGYGVPFLNNQGYAFAYDDQGGYSSDITVEFPEDGTCQLGIHLGYV